MKHDMFSFHICDSGGSAACSTLSASESHSSYMPLTAIRASQMKVAIGPATGAPPLCQPEAAALGGGGKEAGLLL